MYKFKATPFILTSFMSLSFQVSSAQVEKPNIIFILADDMGVGDAGCYGQTKIKTPNIDALAKSGIQFMQHYSGSTVSAPSRCSLLTGKHTGHSAIRGNKGEESALGQFDLSLPESEVTIAEILQQKGYATFCVGKWGLGGPQTQGSPCNQGFDDFFGYLSQGAAHRYYPEFLYENDKKVPTNGVYSHYLIIQKGLEYIEKNADKPFFGYFAVTPPHADLDIPDLGQYDKQFPEKPHINNSKKGYKTQLQPKAAYAAMVSEVDKNVGQIVTLLKEKGILENTILIFSSDNGVHSVGGNDPEFFDSNGPFRGYKRDLYEGGVRTPFIVSWPAQIKTPFYSYHVSTFWDFLPTVCDIVGVELPKGIDGISYLPELLQNSKKQKKYDYIYYEFYEQGGKQSILRKDGWKIVRLQVSNPSQTYEELYNIYHDPSESANVIKQYPKIAGRLRKALDRQRTENPNFNFNNKNQNEN
ncbi:MAG: Arylsulfatase precursor [Bacteroidetes bacterium ADurb.Bin174]|nr:MAG: Arylsulfatase precursor [Bacteroidetes bacterium ADurb.Bin174]